MKNRFPRDYGVKIRAIRFDSIRQQNHLHFFMGLTITIKKIIRLYSIARRVICKVLKFCNFVVEKKILF